jgi:sugar O-acyltransferase (sialic acid O-acetyltransferase NeuD family)
MIIFGASGHGKVIASALENVVSFFFDDNPPGGTFCDVVVQEYDPKYQPKELLVIAIGDNKIRKTVAEKVTHSFGIVQAISAEVDISVVVGKGSQIIHGAIIQADSKIGNHSIINTGASVDHDCSIGDYCHIAPQVTLCGNVTVGEGTIVGAGSTVIPGITIGKWCKIGAGSVVTKNIPDHSIAVGNPARIIKTNG